MQRMACGLTPFWFWNDASDCTQKIDYLHRCREGGINALIMHARCGNLIPYASSEWYAQIRAVVEEGARCGMTLWLYDEDPYPSGAAGGRVMAQYPERIATALQAQYAPAGQAGELWTIGRDPVVWAGLVPCSRPLPVQDLTQAVGTVRQDWFHGEWDSLHYYPECPLISCPRGGAVNQTFALRRPEIPDGYQLLALTAIQPGEEGAWGCLPDLLCPGAFDVFAACSLDPYIDTVGEFFGTTIPGIFTDEAKAHGGFPLTRDLFSAFQQEFGYDLRPRLYQLFGAPLGDEWIRTRLDYRHWVGERFLSVFVRPYRQYCEQHNLLLIGHMSPEDDPIQEAVTLTSVMPIMRELHYPGTDLIVPVTGNRAAPLLNLGSLRIASLRAQLQRPCCTSESLGLSRYDTTSAQARHLLAWQKCLGVDRFFPHGFFMGNEGVAAYEAPPDFGPDSPLFSGISLVNKWLSRLDRFTDSAEDRPRVAVLNSLTSFHAFSPGENREPFERLRRSLAQILLNCLETQVAVHLVDEADLPDARAEDGRLIVGACAYEYLLIPALELLPEAVWAAIRRAEENQVAIYWFGNGIERVVLEKPGNAPGLRSVSALPGRVLEVDYPGTPWCREHLPRAVRVQGKGNRFCRVRRFYRPGDSDYLFCVNTGNLEFDWTLRSEPDSAWMPVDELMDGVCRSTAGKTVWQVPPQGCALFRLVAATADRPGRGRKSETKPAERETGQNCHFEALEPNVLRLSSCVISAGEEMDEYAYPQPYWQRSEYFSARRVVPTFLGDVPVDSRVLHSDLQYAFLFRLKDPVCLDGATLVLDPRCARGRFTLRLNNRKISDTLLFPLERTTALRLPLKAKWLRRGNNRLVLHFQAESAMDGLYSPLFLEGKFLVKPGFGEGDIDCVLASAEVPSRGFSLTNGWQGGGYPYYAGPGRYVWEEDWSRTELAAAPAWQLTLDHVTDSAQLILNGVDCGARAWAPWTWPLPALRSGRNIFELTVCPNPANRLMLHWPNTEQGWIGAARISSIDG